MKSDTGKPQWWLLRGMIPAIDYVMLVREYGVKKYKDPDNWLTVTDGHRRYVDAACRHLSRVVDGESIDPESGLLHLGHAACSALFALAFALRGMTSTEPRWRWEDRGGARRVDMQGVWPQAIGFHDMPIFGCGRCGHVHPVPVHP
jgi:hypothetical protein